MKLPLLAAVLLTILAGLPGAATESCGQTAKRVQRFLDVNPDASIGQITPFIGDQETLFYCSSFDKLSGAVLPRLTAAVNRAEAREREKKPAASPVAVVTEGNFDGLLEKAKGPIVLVGLSDWCRACRPLTAVVNDLAGETRGRVLFATLDVDAYPTLSDKLKISSSPTIVLFKGGKELDRHVGPFEKPALAAFIDSAEAREPANTGSGGPVAVATASNFEALLSRADTPVVIVAVASWCAPCRSITSIVAQLATERRGRTAFATLDVDADPKLTTHLKISNLPTLILFKGDNEISRHVGLLDKAALAAWMDTPSHNP